MKKLYNRMNFGKLNISSLYSLLLAFICGGMIIYISGNSPFEIYGILLNGAIGSKSGILQTILQSTPLLFCGLSVLLGLKGGILNLGVEGQLYIGALFSSLVAIYLKGLPAPLHVLLCVVAGMLGGMLWAFLPIWLKIKRGAHEVVTALMMNYIAVLFLDFLLNYPIRDPDSSVAQTVLIETTAQLPRLFPRSKVTIAILFGILLGCGIYFLLYRSRLGYKIILVGSNVKAAAASGIHVNRILILSMLLSGLCAGLAGTMEVLGSYHRLIQGFSSGYGFEGIAVAVLGSSPISVIFSALLFGGLKAGGIALNFGTNLSVKFISVLQGLIILFIAAPKLIPNLKKRFQSTIQRKEG
ncbi:MAG: ABC transporter permease [Tissierellia bacterium]|nr:ABC transporter permease [Tissierellia bacterium]